MEQVKDDAPRPRPEQPTGADDGERRPGLLVRLLSWRPSLRDLALDKDPALWRHHDVRA